MRISQTKEEGKYLYKINIGSEEVGSVTLLLLLLPRTEYFPSINLICVGHYVFPSGCEDRESEASGIQTGLIVFKSQQER